MDAVEESISKLEDWSLHDPDTPKLPEREHSEESKYADEKGLVHFTADFASEYLEISDDEEENCDIGGINTLGRSDEEFNLQGEAAASAASDLQRNPLDGLPYSSQYYELLQERQKLAIWQAKDDFVLAVDESPVVLVTGAAGTGKSTQIPQWCAHFAKEMDFELGTVVCTQPDALAAMSLAMQVTREMDLTSIGNEVGYKVPFSDVATEDTILKFCTDEILLREMTDDPLLEKYSIVIVDEVQERTVSTDVLLTLLNRIVSTRRDTLKIIVISLPHEMPKLEEFFDGVPVVDLSFLESSQVENNGDNPRRGSDDPISHDPLKVPAKEKIQRKEDRDKFNVNYLTNTAPTTDFVSEAVELITTLHSNQDLDGDILVFMPGPNEINEVCERVAREVAMKVLRGEAGDITIVSLYKDMPYNTQQAVYSKPHQVTAENTLYARKVIVCDSIAEYSFSVGNISCVVDSGRERANIYNCRTRAKSTFLVFISKLNAELRSRRCRPGGQVFRLYSETEYNKFDQLRAPPMTQTELSSSVLLMKRLLQRLDVPFSSCQTLDPPAPDNYMQALEDLDYHGALDDNGNLSDLGAVMSEFPLSLRLAKSVIASCGELCTEEMLTIASMLSVPCCFVPQSGSKRKTEMSRVKMAHPAGDHFTLMNIFNEFTLHKESEQWCKENSLCYSSLKLATQVRSELEVVMDRLELPRSPRISNSTTMESSVKRAILAGFFMQIAKDVDGSGNYLIVHDRHVARLSPQTSINNFPEWVVFNEFILSDNSYIVTVTDVTIQMIVEISPPSYIANLPSGEIKDMVLEETSRLREENEGGTSESENVAGAAGNDLPSRTNFELKEQRKTSLEHENHSKLESKTYRYTGSPSDRLSTNNSSSNFQDAPIQTNMPQHGDMDIITQTARDLNYVYQQASSYVRNYNYHETDDQSCLIQ